MQKRKINKQNKKTTKASPNLNSKIQPLNSNARGITLIALIITIIIMLILVLTAVSVTMNSGLFEKAAKAGDEWEKADKNLVDDSVSYIDEKVTLATGGAITKIIPREEAENEYIKSNENITEVVQTKTASKTYEIPIPDGFTASRATGEGAIDTGLVIYETEEEINDSNVEAAKTSINQFVWIPVEEIEDMYICHVFNSEGTTAEATACKFELAEVTENGETVEKIKCNTHNSYDMAGYSYTNRTMTTRITSYTPNSGRREPGVVDGTEDGTGRQHDAAQSSVKRMADILGEEGYEDLDAFKQTLQNDYNEIAKSIYKYKGFYVGRYETSNIASTETGEMVVQAGKIPLGSTYWYIMYAKQKLYKVDDTAVGSTMINGVAYDQVIKFVDGGTRPDGTPYTAKTVGNAGHDASQGAGSRYYTGGANYKVQTDSMTNYIPYNDVSKNIYDLEGNVAVWTTEANSTDGRVVRGRRLCKCQCSSFES